MYEDQIGDGVKTCWNRWSWPRSRTSSLIPAPNSVPIIKLVFNDWSFTNVSSRFRRRRDHIGMTHSIWLIRYESQRWNCSKNSILLLYISICFCFEQMILSSRKNCFLNLMNLYRQHFLEQVFICLDCLPLLTAAATFTASPVDVFKNDSLLQGCDKRIWLKWFWWLYDDSSFIILVTVLC